MKFTEDETCQLMEIYVEYDCLWNMTSVHYRNRNKRQAAEEEILERFGKIGFGVNEFKQKIKNLRCTYNQERIKIMKSKKSGSGSAEVYIPNLKWFPLMDNIVKSAKGNKTTDNSVESVVRESTSLQDLQENELGQDIDDTGFTLETTETQPQPQHTPEHPKRSASRSAKSSIKKRKIEQLADAVQYLRRVAESVMIETDNNNDRPTSEQDAFGNFVAATLKLLPAPIALQAQHEIQGLLMKHRLSVISSEKSSTSAVNSSRTPEVSTSPEVVVFEEDMNNEVVIELSPNYVLEDHMYY